MKWLPLASLAVLFLMVPAPVQAQSPNPSTAKGTINIATSELSPTPEMWFYEQQLRQYNDPKQMARQRAEFKSAERQRRITMMAWYGASNSRPRAGTDPVHGDIMPGWTSGHYLYPLQWSPFGPSAIVLRSSNRD